MVLFFEGVGIYILFLYHVAFVEHGGPWCLSGCSKWQSVAAWAALVTLSYVVLCYTLVVR